MKKSMIVMMMMVIAFSMNLFGEVVSEKAVDHVCTAECKHEEVKKEMKCDHPKSEPCTEKCHMPQEKKTCEPDCTKPCCADKASVENHECTEKCESVKNHVCTDECKLDEKTEMCELAMLKDHCSNEAKKLGCKPADCEQKVINKDCHK